MKEPRNKLIPTLRYADARAAIRWLAEAFGFEVKLIVEAHGGRAYSCLDPEGYLWNIGSYDPWAEPEASPR